MLNRELVVPVRPAEPRLCSRGPPEFPRDRRLAIADGSTLKRHADFGNESPPQSGRRGNRERHDQGAAAKAQDVYLHGAGVAQRGKYMGMAGSVKSDVTHARVDCERTTRGAAQCAAEHSVSMA